MEDTKKPDDAQGAPANDNRPPVRREREHDADADIAPWQRIDTVARILAQLIGRQIARERLAAGEAANDDTRATTEEAEAGAGPEQRDPTGTRRDR